MGEEIVWGLCHFGYLLMKVVVFINELSINNVPQHLKHLNMRGFIMCVLLMCYGLKSKAQSITPFTLNIGGFDGTQSGYSITISTGEAISITDFKSPNGLGLSSGFLQNNPPLVTGIEEVNTPFGPNEIKITPNPLQSKTQLLVNIKGGGQLQYQLFDIGSKLLYRSQAFAIYGYTQNLLDFSNYPTGQYYVQVVFKPITGKVKSGIYKIIKL